MGSPGDPGMFGSAHWGGARTHPCELRPAARSGWMAEESRRKYRL